MIDAQFLQTIPQYGIGGFVGKVFKKVKDTVKKVAEPAGAAIGFMIGGPTGAAIGGGIGSLVAGKDSNRALRTAALGFGLGNLAGAGFFGRGIQGLSAQGFMGFPGTGNILSGQMLSPDLGSRFYSGIGNLIPGGEGGNFLFSGQGSNVSPQLVSNFANQYNISNAEALRFLSGNQGGRGLGSATLQYGLPLLAGYSAYQAAQGADEFIPPDEARLNPFYYQNPEEFQVAGQGVKPVYYDTLQDYQGIPVNELPDDFFRAAEGGVVQLANGSKKFFPRKNGAINGPGTGTSDDIPAMLSDGEFVFTAKAVRNAGGGDRREGAKRMYQTMKNLEKGGTLSPQSRGVN